MVVSQVASQHPSRCLSFVGHRHKSWGLSNAEERLSEVETSERDCEEENSDSGSSLMPLRVNASSGYGTAFPSIRSSWIQRLVPPQISGADLPQATMAVAKKGERINGIKADWNKDSDVKLDGGNEPVNALYKNSRRSRQVVSSRHQVLLNKITTYGELFDQFSPQMGRACLISEALQPRIHVPPRTLPVVESLLINRRCSKSAVVTEVSSKTNKFEGLKSHCLRCWAKDLKAPLGSEKWPNASSLVGEFSFKHSEEVLRSNMEPINKGMQTKTCTYFGINHMDGQQAGGSNCSESKDPVSCTGMRFFGTTLRAASDSFMHRRMMPLKSMQDFPDHVHTSIARQEESLHLGRQCLQKACNMNHEHLQNDEDCEKGVEMAFEAFSAERKGAYLSSELEKHGPQDFSNFIFSTLDANAREKLNISLAPADVEQRLDISQYIHKEKDVASGSFSFNPKNVSYGSVNAIERVDWPFYKNHPHYIEYSVQTGASKGSKARGLVEARRLESSLNNPSVIQQVDNGYKSTSQYSSPFVTTDSVLKYGKQIIASDQNISRYLPKYILSKDSFVEEPKVEAVYNKIVTSDAKTNEDEERQFDGGMIDLRLRPKSTKDLKSREDQNYFSSVAITKNYLEAVKPLFKLGPISVASTESTSKRPADVWNQCLANILNASTEVLEPGSVPSTHFEKHTPSLGVGNSLKNNLNASKYAAGQGVSWVGSVLRKKMWLRRWSKRRPQKGHSVFRSEGFVNSRCVARYSSLQSTWDSSHYFDLRPAKRTCYGQRFGPSSETFHPMPLLGSICVGPEHQQAIGFTSHFMKRFLTPSAAAFAVLGMTARNVHASQPQQKGLFALWPAASSTKRLSKGWIDATQDCSLRQENKKEFLHFPAKRSSNPVNA